MKKRHNALLWLVLLVCVAFARPAFTQDDVYYDPDKDAPASYDFNDDNRDHQSDVNTTYEGDNDDENYDDEDYAYEYSSRIRRFHRPAVIVDYYDPFYVDLWTYDPFFLPGASIYTYGYNDYYSWRRWQRWQRYNSWNNPYSSYGCGYNSWGWQSGWGYNRPWGNTFVTNNYYYDPYWTWNGYNPYYSEGWVNNNYYYNNGGGYNGNGNGYRPKTYTGPRRGGTTVNPGYAAINDGSGRNGRLVAESTKNVPTIEMGRKNGRTIVSDREPVSNSPNTTERTSAKPGRTSPATTDGRSPQTDRRQPNTDRTTPATTRPGSANPAGRQEEEAVPGRRAPQTSDPVRTPRTEERRERPSDSGRQQEEQRSRRSSEQREEPRPSRRSYDEPQQRTERRVEERTNRTERQQEARPSRSETPRSNDSGSSRSSGSTRSESSKSSTPASSGSSKRGRN